MLAKLGLQVQLATNGAEAIDRVRETTFDLVLMDCQMPVMDGYQATAAIRALPDGRGVRLPIVALTANVMPGDEKACLDAGMNGFLGKPYTRAALRATLACWLGGPLAAPDEAAPGNTIAALNDTATEAPAINPNAIAILRDLDETGGMSLAAELLGAFVDSAEAGLARVEAAVAAANAKALGQAAHSLKSSAANLGAETLARCYADLEKCGREGRIDDARRLIEPTRREQRRALAQMQELLAEAA